MKGPPWWVALAVLAADQVTKVIAVGALEDAPVGIIDGVLSLRLTRNPGAAFSSFTGGGQALAVVALVIAVGIVVIVARAASRTEQVALLLILGGALGNLTDRVFRGSGVLDGAVVDFVDFSFWPTFNLADSAISVGVVLLVARAVFTGGQSPPARATEATGEAGELRAGDD